VRWGKRISHLLLLIVLCILIFYVGIYLQIDTSGDFLSFEINQKLLESAGEMYLTGLFYTEESSESEKDTIHQIISDVGIDLSPSLFPIGITATIKDKYIVIAFNLGLAVVDIDDWKCVTKIPLKYGISSVLVTDNGKYMWFGSSKGIQCFFIKDVIKGIISEKSIY